MRGWSCFGCDSETCEATLGLTLLCPAINKAGYEEPLRALGYGQEEANQKSCSLSLLKRMWVVVRGNEGQHNCPIQELTCGNTVRW